MAHTYKRKTDRPYNNKKPQNLPTKFRSGFLAGLDKRTDLAKTLRANFEEIAEDLGGQEELSHIKRSLIERYVWLQAIVETFQQQINSGEELDKATLADLLQRWTASTTTLLSLAKTLGIDRKASAGRYADLIHIDHKGD